MKIYNDCFLDFSIKKTFLLTVDDVVNHAGAEVKSLLKDCNLYMFLTAPKVRFKKDSLVLSESRIEAEVELRLGGEYVRLPWMTEINNTIPDEAFVGFNNDFTEFHIANENKDILPGTNFYAIEAFRLGSPEKFIFDIMYIGQSIGKNENISFIDRVQGGHKTLLKIMASMTNQPDIQIYIMGLKVERMPEALMINNFAPIGNQEEIELKDQITLTEASLIRYFQPPYNKEFVNSFPNPDSPVIKRALRYGATGVMSKFDAGVLLRTKKIHKYTGCPILVTFHNRQTLFEDDELGGFLGKSVHIIRPSKG